MYEKMNDAEKKGKCFPFFNRRKTLFFDNVVFFSLIGIQFPLITFLYYCQTWKSRNLLSCNQTQPIVIVPTHIYPQLHYGVTVPYSAK